MTRPMIIDAPQEVRLRKRENRLEVLWADGQRTSLSGLMLRRSCACSLCIQAQQTGALTLIDADVGVARLEVNGYAVVEEVDAGPFLRSETVDAAEIPSRLLLLPDSIEPAL